MSQVAMSVAGPVKENVGKKMLRLQRALLEVVTPERVSAIAEKMQEKAMEGSVAAAKLVFGYVFGRPDRAISFHLGGREEEEDRAAEAIARALVEGKPGEPEFEALVKEVFGQREARPQEAPARRANGLNGGGRRK